jgi:hypothetical protein
MHYYDQIRFMLLIFHQPKYHVHIKHNIYFLMLIIIECSSWHQHLGETWCNGTILANAKSIYEYTNFAIPLFGFSQFQVFNLILKFDITF